MTDQAAPDYPLDDELTLETTAQFRALFDETRLQIIDLLSERAATTSQLADAMDRPKGTIGHHLGVLAEAGLVHVVRTERVRAIEAKYYGRTARTFDLRTTGMREAGIAPETVLAGAVADVAAAAQAFADAELPGISTVRYARLPTERAAEWAERLAALVAEFIAEPRAGDVVYGLAVGLYPTARPHLAESP